MAIGKVKWFNNAKGYGFILREGGGEDLFAHFSSIQMEGYRTLKAGQDVEFEIVEGAKGLHAVEIKPMDSGPEASADSESAQSPENSDEASSDEQPSSVTSETVEEVTPERVDEIS